MKRRFATVAGPVFGLLVLAITVPLSTACEGFEFNWFAIEDTVALYSLARPELIGQPAAYDFYARRRVVLEEPVQGDPYFFDMALTESGGEFVFLPAGMFATFTIEPGIAIDSSGTSFEELAIAPRTGYVTDAAVPVRMDVLYAVRTRQDNQGCSRYAKFEVLDVDPDGVVEFRQVRNNLCNDRELIPPDQD